MPGPGGPESPPFKCAGEREGGEGGEGRPGQSQSGLPRARTPRSECLSKPCRRRVAERRVSRQRGEGEKTPRKDEPPFFSCPIWRWKGGQLVAELRLEAGLLTLGVLHFLFLSFRMVPAGSSFCLDPPVLYSLQVLLTHK